MARQPFVEFAGNKRLLWIAEEWIRYAPRLAEWAMERIVNRRDVWSQYTIKNDRISVVMLPIKERRKLGTDMVTITKLERHFSGRSPAHLIGLHSISDHATCKWFAIDIDLHDESVPNADEIIEANKAATFEWAGRLRDMGMDPLVLDSNGEGGFHIWVLLDDEYLLADVFDFADSIRQDWQELGLPRKPEIFPPKRAVGPDDLPYTLRLAGRHHTRPHYTRVYNFDFADENEWLDGGDAIEAMMATRPAKLPRVKGAKKRSPNLREIPLKAKKAAPVQRPRVCLDLDGVIATYGKWRGFDHIGPPVPGAVDFARQLSEVADIIVFTARCSGDPGPDGDMPLLTTGQMRIKVIEWLEKHHFPYKDVYVGQGKPRVAAFIDDRAVSCSPQTDADAFDTALDSVYKILGRKARKK